MRRDAAIAELVAAFSDPTLLRVIDPRHRTPDDLIQATFAMEHGATMGLAMAGLFGDGLVVVELDGEPIALHAVCDDHFFDPFGLSTRDELLAGWADFCQEPVSRLRLRPSNDEDIENFEIDRKIGERAADLRDAISARCAEAINTLRR